MGYLSCVDLDEVADRLYALPPSEFTAARTAQARAAKDAGDARLSREIARLRKPTVSAWAVNRLAREHPGELAELLDVGERLRAAWQEQDADALAELTRRRGEVAARAGRLARQEGELSAAAGTEVDQTLDAALVDAAAAAEVRQGRLVKPLQYSGFAPAPIPREPVSRRKRSTQEKAGDEAARARAQEEARPGRPASARRPRRRTGSGCRSCGPPARSTTSGRRRSRGWRRSWPRPARGWRRPASGWR